MLKRIFGVALPPSVGGGFPPESCFPIVNTKTLISASARHRVRTAHDTSRNGFIHPHDSQPTPHNSPLSILTTPFSPRATAIAQGARLPITYARRVPLSRQARGCWKFGKRAHRVHESNIDRQQKYRMNRATTVLDGEAWNGWFQSLRAAVKIFDL